MKNIPLNERIIFALDFAQAETALDWVARLDAQIKFFKVGLQLFLAGGFPVIDAIIRRGNKVMVDLKFFDIPETVHLAVQQLTERGITFATVHGNEPMIAAALRDRKELQILAVTVLTSFDQNDLRRMGITIPLTELVLERARQALALGSDGIVASAQEAAMLRRHLGTDFTIVTPGVRPAGSARADQVRVTTARQAIINGADHLVIGRPIKNDPQPQKLVATLLQEISKALLDKLNGENI
ncbi:MAG: orotidine-5'-phosphate decarboxylase [Proteobacteria bacterium]|nr:orotidine-5'-phosphate decarboxylase [Pseudomonadota bacterium]MBU1716893.1 orotidine-5'-phosphate decarboxylase [Pseudomonadota bacterium]